MMTGTVHVFQAKICNAKFGDLGTNGVRSNNSSSKVPHLQLPTLICLFNFHGALIMIKCSLGLLLSAPIVKRFRSKKNQVPFWAKI